MWSVLQFILPAPTEEAASVLFSCVELPWTRSSVKLREQCGPGLSGGSCLQGCTQPGARSAHVMVSQHLRGWPSQPVLGCLPYAIHKPPWDTSSLSSVACFLMAFTSHPPKPPREAQAGNSPSHLLLSSLTWWKVQLLCPFHSPAAPPEKKREYWQLPLIRFTLPSFKITFLLTLLFQLLGNFPKFSHPTFSY